VFASLIFSLNEASEEHGVKNDRKVLHAVERSVIIIELLTVAVDLGFSISLWSSGLHNDVIWSRLSIKFVNLIITVFDGQSFC
jgi:hypothetical protein